MLNKKTFGHRKPSRRSAFSLIELSIVLIIIGLLISGIIGGASLIKSATLRSVMTEARGYNVATSAFYTKYNALPGDYAGPVGTNTDLGDGNGLINYIAATINPNMNKESALAAKQLYQDGSLDASMFSSTTTVASATTTGLATATPIPALTVKTDIPGGKLKGSGWFLDNATYTGTGLDGIAINLAVLSGGTTASTGNYTAGTAVTTAGDFSTGATTGHRVVPILTPQDASSIDVKMDDGVPYTGSVRPVAARLGTGTATTDGCTLLAPGAALVAATKYNSVTTTNCALGFRIDVTS